MPRLTWSDIEDIALALSDAHPDVDPLTARFVDLRRWVLELPGFTGAADASSERRLEGIQMAWYEEWKEEHGPSPLESRAGRGTGLRPDEG